MPGPGISPALYYLDALYGEDAVDDYEIAVAALMSTAVPDGLSSSSDADAGSVVLDASVATATNTGGVDPAALLPTVDPDSGVQTLPAPPAGITPSTSPMLDACVGTTRANAFLGNYDVWPRIALPALSAPPVAQTIQAPQGSQTIAAPVTMAAATTLTIDGTTITFASPYTEPQLTGTISGTTQTSPTVSVDPMAALNSSLSPSPRLANPPSSPHAYGAELPFYFPPQEGDIFPLTPYHDTGSTILNYAVNGFYGLSNLAGALLNMPGEIMAVAADAARAIGFNESEIEAAQMYQGVFAGLSEMRLYEGAWTTLAHELSGIVADERSALLELGETLPPGETSFWRSLLSDTRGGMPNAAARRFLAARRQLAELAEYIVPASVEEADVLEQAYDEVIAVEGNTGSARSRAGTLVHKILGAKGPGEGIDYGISAGGQLEYSGALIELKTHWGGPLEMLYIMETRLQLLRAAREASALNPGVEIGIYQYHLFFDPRTRRAFRLVF